MRIFAPIIFAAALSLTQQAIAADAPALTSDIARLAHEWDHAKYEITDQDQQKQAMAALSDEADKVTAQYPNAPEPLIWNAIIKSSEAGLSGGFTALGLVKDSRKLLEKAEAMDPNAMDGAISITLGSLYYQVPGFPISFGSDKKARKYLEKAIALAPNDIDANYFYGDFLMKQGDYRKADAVLHHALEAPARPGREIGDKGRRGEVRELLTQLDQKLDHQS